MKIVCIDRRSHCQSRQNLTIFQKKVRFLWLSKSRSHTLQMLEQFLEQFIFHPDERQVSSNHYQLPNLMYNIYLFLLRKYKKEGFRRPLTSSKILLTVINCRQITYFSYLYRTFNLYLFDSFTRIINFILKLK